MTLLVGAFEKNVDPLPPSESVDVPSGDEHPVLFLGIGRSPRNLFR